MELNDKNNNDVYLLSFDQNWSKAKEADQILLIEKALKFPPGQGVIPLLQGMNSYYFSVRTKAKQGLCYFKTKISKLMENYSCKEELLYALKESALFSAKIYNELKPELPAQEIRFYCEVLLESNGRGPFYAWKFWQTKGVSKETLKNITIAVSEKGRLLLVDQYLQARPLVRKKFANEFKKILKSIESCKSVMGFYAWLFDNKRYADPFLSHLNSDLMNSDTIISQYIMSSVPEIREQGLKALSMIIAKIEPSLLVNFLSDKEDPIVRETVFKIIGNSPHGTYCEFFDNIYNFICKSETLKISEAFEAFRALIVSRPFPMSKLIDKLKDDVPQLIADVSEKISSLSGFSSPFILEMAENPAFLYETSINSVTGNNSIDRRNCRAFEAIPGSQELSHNRSYRNKTKDIYKALVYGMIIKRPERILKILEKHGKSSNDELRMAIMKLSNKIKESLSREKQEINEEFSKFKIKFEIISHPNGNKKSNFFKSIFSDSADKKIKLLKKENFDGDIDFQGETIENADLSACHFSNLNNFNESIIKNSDLSDSAFLNSSFKKTVFLNVGLNGTKFHGISFYNSVFIGVNADNAEFINCSFNGASFFNTSFKNAGLQGSTFIDSVISKVSFSHADLSDASFACSKIASVAFTESRLFHTDFTGIQARFCRFPSHSNVNIETCHADFNARLFQFDEQYLLDSLFNVAAPDLPLISDINLMIYAEFIHFGKKMFLRQNKFSLLTAIDIFKSRAADLFEIVPLMIHENINFPGYNSTEENPPHGISGYFPSDDTGSIAAKYLPKDSLVLKAYNNCYVESLFTIGSTGSIAQSFDSDIDYWVCIRDNDYKGKLRLKFQQKLEKLEKWALTSFRTEIHFFVVDIEKAKNDDFGTSSVESSGSAQGKILKEEFYRTMIYVAGKLPFWCALPVSISKNYYETLYSMICVTPYSCRYIDLGDIQYIPGGEYFGASIWQMFKSLKSPFKSIIKISLIEKFIDESGDRPLLCNLFKEKWMNPGQSFDLSKNDPYYILLVSLIQYYDHLTNTEAARFIQLCFFLKTGISSISDLDYGVFGFRKLFIMHCMKQWNWKKEDVFKFGGFQHWQYDNIMKLSLSIEKYMLNTYKRVRRGFNKDDIGHNFLIKPEDKIALGRKIFVQFSEKPAKIKKILLISKNNDHFQGLNLRLCQDRKKTISWELIHKSGKISRQKEEILKKARTIEEIGAWLIHNKFYSESTLINLVPNSTPVTYEDIRNLFNGLNAFFGHDTNDTEFNILLAKDMITSLFISINFAIPRNIKQIFECSLIYMNSWGEMFSQFIWRENGFDSIEELMKIIKNKLGIDSFPDKTVYYSPKKFKPGLSGKV